MKGVYSLLVGHLSIEISSLSYHFLKKLLESKIIVKIMGKREREIGLVVPANFVYIPKDKNCFKDKNYFGGQIREKKNIVSRFETYVL